MGLLKLKAAFVCLASIVATMSVFADAVVDATFDDNQNEFEFYWYYYDDNAGLGENDRPQNAEAATLKPSIVEVDYTEQPRKAFGDEADTWLIKKYKFRTTNSLARNCATVPFVFGDIWETTYGTGSPFIGIGTMLTEEDSAIDLRGVTSVSFYIKSRVNALSVVFKVQTLEIDNYSDKPGAQLEGDEFGYYGKTISVTAGDWQLITVDLEDLALPGTWAKKIAFDTATCTKLAWEVLYDENVTRDTLDIADVNFIGPYQLRLKSTWYDAETVRPEAGLFSSFDKTPYNESPLTPATYWYAYNDVEIGGNSSVSETYAKLNTTTGRLDIQFAAGTGSDGIGRGAALEYTLGDPIPKDTISILGFVGVGVNVYDSAAATYFDATDATKKQAFTDIFFEYYTDAGAKNITLEVSDKNDVGDYLNPTRKDTRGSGIVWYKNFPATNGVWKWVKIPISALVTHNTWGGYVHIPLDMQNLAKFQWKVQGGKGTNGLFAVDNIFLVGADFGQILPVGRSLQHSGRNAGAFNIALKNNMVNVKWDGASALRNGKVSLVNLKGIVMASALLNNTSTATLSTPSISNGMYFVTINAVDANNKAHVQHLPVNIVK